MSKPPIRVLCVDDHAIVRQGIALLIGNQLDIEVVGSAATGEEAVALFKTLLPDVTLMDLQLPGMSGLEAITTIRRQYPDARFVVLTMYYGDQDIRRALDVGATTYLLKDTLADDLIGVIRDVHAGNSPLEPRIQARLSESAAERSLTPREVEVVQLVSRGMRNKEIAVSLGISEETVQVHVKNVLTKLKVNDRTAAVHIALRRGIIHIQ